MGIAASFLAFAFSAETIMSALNSPQSQIGPLMQSQIPQYGQDKVQSPNCILLWSSLGNQSLVKPAQKAVVIKNKLLSKFVRLEQLDGAKSENMNLKTQLLKISCKKGKYPQIFIKDENNQIRFIGLDSDINFLIQSGNFDKVFGLCMDGGNGSPNLDNKKEAMRYKKLAEQWYGAKNLIKAQKFALKSLQFEDAEDVKEMLNKIKAQFNETYIYVDDVCTDDMQLDEEKNEVPIIQTNDNRNLPQQSSKKKNKQKQKPKQEQGNDDLVNQIIEQSMVLQQQNKELEKENKLLKQRLKISQEQHFEQQKNEMKGVCYECDVVKEYNSKQRNDIPIRDGVQLSQNKSNEKLSGHKTRLSEWDKYTKNLDDEFNKENEKYFKKFMSQKNANDDDAKCNDEDDDKNKKDDESMNVSVLYLSYKHCMELLEEQKQRTEDVMPHCSDLFEATKNLKSIIKIYNNDVPETKRKYDGLCSHYNSLKQKRQNLQEKVKNLVIEINKLIDEENNCNNDKCQTLDKFNLLRKELDEYQQLFARSKDLTTKYSNFESNVEHKTDELKEYFVSKWTEHEQNWTEWNVNGIICWFKYLIHDNKLRLSKEFNLKIVEQKMMEQQMKGVLLNTLDRNDLKPMGIVSISDRIQTYKRIRALVEKYPNLQKDDDDDEKGLFDADKITADGQKEGFQIKIPQEYICPISKEIMKDPVKAYDLITYERENIVEYIKKYKRAPNCEHECDGDEPLLRNRQLKTKIEQFLEANPSLLANQ